MKNIFLCAAFFIFFVCCYSPPNHISDGTTASIQYDEEISFQNESLLEPPLPDSALPVTSFKEIWAYLINGRESTLNADYPITDIGYFGAEIDSYGKLIGVPDTEKLSFFGGNIHLVIGCNGRALTHFVLAEGSGERRALIADILEAVKPYHGLQIDFEYVPARDGNAFLSFLAELRAGLGGRILSVALPARTRTLDDDVYNYSRIEPLVDRILVMAYDEHWSTSEPGPIASIDWCRRIASYSLNTISPEKLIMGLPFYGRGWGDINPNRAYLHSGIERIIMEQNITEINRENGIPTFEYEVPLSVTVYYEDAYSLSTRLDMYKKMEVSAVGFWCLGQETPEFWSLIRAGGGLNP